MIQRSVLTLVLVFTAFGQTRSRLADYALVLEDEPVARRVKSRAALRSNEGESHAARIRSAQGSVIGELRRRGVTVTDATQSLVNAVLVSATEETARQLRQIPGVKYVIRAPRVKPNLDRATEMSNVQAAYAALGGAAQAGTGVKIGIIDSGFDLTHPGLQDASMRAPAGFPKGQTAYTNGKVIVARSYMKDVGVGFTTDPEHTPPENISRPDDDTPRDFIGHGTALAMIAAGASNTDRATGITIQGVAPKAFLGNYKIFGSPGLNDVSKFAGVEHALNDAIADGMDIVTLSLSEGDPAFDAPLDVDNDPNFCGGPCDIYSQAVEAATRMGVVVVVSAGNSGNIGRQPRTWLSVHRPGTAPSGITVGALMNSRAMYQSVRTGGQTYKARFGVGPQLQAPLTATIRYVGLACSAIEGSLAGSIALIERGECFIDQKINNAQRAGAIAAVIYQAAGDDLSSLLPAMTTGIPSALVGNADGNALKAVSGNVTLDPAFTPSEATGNVVWPASSRGPSPGDFGVTKTNVIKPEVAAVGANIFTAAQRLNPSGDGYNATGYTSVSGTSYATALVAGAAALVKQKNPGFTPAQIKSAVVNTANQDVTDLGGTASVRSVGAGRLNIGDAVNATFTVSPATISFGELTPTTISDSRTVTISGGAGVSYTVAVAPRSTPANGLVPTVSTVSGGSFTVRLQGSRPAPGAYEGFIEVRGGSQTLRVPYLYMVGDGVPADVFPIANGSFVGGVSDQEWLIALRAVDQYGVPVVGIQARFAPVSGGGQLNRGDDQTFRLGNSAMLVDLGPNPGENIFRGTVGGPAGPSVDFSGLARHYPQISASGVVNAATSQTGVAAGSYISIYGTDFSEATQVEPTPFLPVALSGVAVTVDADGVSLPAKLHFISPRQVNAQIPWEFAGKESVKIKIWSDFMASNVVTVPLAQYAPGIFEVNGLAAAQNGASYALITRQAPAKRGDTIILYMNGLGPVTNTPASGEATSPSALSTTPAAPSVTIGGRPAQAIFSGLTPGAVGLYQINLTIAADTPTGDQPIVVTIGGASSKASVLPVQ